MGALYIFRSVGVGFSKVRVVEMISQTAVRGGAIVRGLLAIILAAGAGGLLAVILGHGGSGHVGGHAAPQWEFNAVSQAATCATGTSSMTSDSVIVTLTGRCAFPRPIVTKTDTLYCDTSGANCSTTLFGPLARATNVSVTRGTADTVLIRFQDNATEDTDHEMWRAAARAGPYSGGWLAPSTGTGERLRISTPNTTWSMACYYVRPVNATAKGLESDSVCVSLTTASGPTASDSVTAIRLWPDSVSLEVGATQQFCAFVQMLDGGWRGTTDSFGTPQPVTCDSIGLSLYGVQYSGHKPDVPFRLARGWVGS